MAPGANVPSKSGTGTVPKTKRNNPVPREMVAPTRRDMQTNNGSIENYEWRVEPENNGTVNTYPNLFDIYYETESNRFVPVRPQPRSTHQEDDHTFGFRSNSPQNMAANTAIVMPTTPGAPRTRENTPYSQRSCIVFNASTPNGSNIAQIESANASSQTPPLTAGKTNNIRSVVPDRQFLEQKIQQIREYIQITSTMMNHAVSDENQLVTEEDVDMIRLANELKESESKLLKQLWELNNNEENESTRNEFQEQDRAASSLSQLSQSSYNTINSKILQQTRRTPENEQSNNIQKNIQLRNSSSNRSSRASSKTNSRPIESNEHNRNHKQVIIKDLQSLLDSVTNPLPAESREVTPQRSEIHGMETTVTELTDRFRRLQSANQQNTPDVFGQMEHIKRLHERITKLKKQSDEREELTRILGERDEQLSAEHQALQTKIRDLHRKKEEVEKLVTDLQNMAIPTQRENSLGAMRAQLSQFQSLLDTVTRTEADLNMNGTNQETPSNINKYNKTNERNRNVYHPIDFPIENRDSLDEEEDTARGGGRFDKKINKNVPSVGRYEQQQMILKAELQAKKRELEELMRKDLDCSSTINQDVCSVTSMDKSDISRFAPEDNFMGRSSVENHSDNDYSSEEDHQATRNDTVRFNGSLRNVPNNANQLNNLASGVHPNHLLNVNKACPKVVQPNSPNLSNNEITTDMSNCTTPEPTTLWRKSSPATSRQINNAKKTQEPTQSNVSNHDNANMSICSGMEVPPPMLPLWRKKSQEGAKPFGPWTYVNSERQDGTNTAHSDPVHQPVQGSREWWQKKALQLQQQLELTSNLCQSIILDQQTNSQSPVSSIQNEAPYPSFVPAVRPQTLVPADLQSQNMMAASQLHFQSMLMTSLNHCYQLIWMQQKELAMLKNMLQDTSMSQQTMPPTCSNSQMPPYPPQKSFTPVVSNNDIVYPNFQNNVPQNNPPQNYIQHQQNIHPSCQHSCPTNTSTSNPPIALPNNAMMSQFQAQPTWNNQALNNQVPPGNRANNYWDNFRSYSRQNLLSTNSKSNEGSAHSPSPLVDRSHNMFRTNGFPGPEFPHVNHAPLPKLNVMQEDKRQKKAHSEVNQNLNNQNSMDVPQGHLLNIFQQNLDLASGVLTHPPSNLEQRDDSNNTRPGFELVEPTCSNSSSNKCSKSCPQRNIYDPNEYRESSRNDSRDEQPKTKLFDMLRDNVYKEVTNLIAANENRPHFLIQLFRDLQLISSDGLRRRTLQSIQGVVTDSFANLPENYQGASRQNITASNIPKQENSQLTESEFKAEIPVLEAETEESQSPTNLGNEIHGIMCNLVPFLHVNLDNVCSEVITEVIQTLALQLVPTFPLFANNPERIKYYCEYCQPQLASNLETALNKFHGCRIRDVTDDLLSTITEVIINELSYFFGDESRGDSNNPSTEQSQSYEHSGNSENRVEVDVSPPQINDNNEDLAEADQSHENDEEGAVGGLFVEGNQALMQSEEDSSENTAGNTEADAEWITFEPLLDCVPSRLTDETPKDPVSSTDKPPGSSCD